MSDGLVYVVTGGRELLVGRDRHWRVERADAMPPMRSCSFLAESDGILLVAGSFEACSYDGSSWSVIFAS